jgi:phosphonate transport system substrate-binding protein
MQTVQPLTTLLVVLTASMACNESPRPESRDAEVTVAGEDDASVAEDIVLRFGVVTRAEPRLTVQGSQPLIDYLTEATPYRVELRMGRSSEDVELDPGMQDLVTFLEERLVEVAPLGVLSYCLADERFGADVLVQTVGDDGEPRARAVFITAPSSDVSSLDDLSGRTVGLGPSHSMLSHVLGVYELDEAGVSAQTSSLQSDEAVLAAVRDGDLDAGVVAEHYVDDSVRVIQSTIAIPSRPLIVRADLPEPVRASLRAALLELEANPEWDRLFRNGFAPPGSVDYAVVRDILNQQGATCTAGCHEPVRFGDER